MKLTYQPDAIIITIGAAWLKERGVKKWARDFLEAMNQYEDGWTYWIRQGAKPTIDVQWLYICIGGRIRYRCNLVEVKGAGSMDFSNGNSMSAKAWLVCAGPVIKAPGLFTRKGFQGFRYTEQIF